MDTRYEDRGYSAEFTEAEYGAFLTIRRDGKIIGECGVCFGVGTERLPQVYVKRFVPDTLGAVTVCDDFDECSASLIAAWQ
jgi:hypothetical protein